MLRLAFILLALFFYASPGQAQIVVNRDSDDRFALPDPPSSSVFESGWTIVDPQALLSLARQGDPQAQVYARWNEAIPDPEKDRWVAALHRQLDPAAAALLEAYPALITFNRGDISTADYRAVLERAAVHGHPGVAIALATLDAGGGANSQTDLADTTWLLQQSATGNTTAMMAACNLAVTPDFLIVPFLPLCRPLAEQGKAEAAWQLAKVYLARHDDFKPDLAPRISQIFKQPPDTAKAITYLQQAADKGHAGAQARLAHLKAIGLGTSRDEAEAVRLAQASAAQNNAEGLTVLGLLTLQGRGGLTPNSQAALPLIKQGAERGNRMAQYTLVTLFLRGQSTNRNFGDALMWLNMLKLDPRSDPEPDAYGDLLLEPWPRTVTVASVVRSPAADQEALRRAVILRQDLAQKGLWLP